MSVAAVPHKDNNTATPLMPSEKYIGLWTCKQSMHVRHANEVMQTRLCGTARPANRGTTAALSLTSVVYLANTCMVLDASQSDYDPSCHGLHMEGEETYWTVRLETPPLHLTLHSLQLPTCQMEPLQELAAPVQVLDS